MVVPQARTETNHERRGTGYGLTELIHNHLFSPYDSMDDMEKTEQFRIALAGGIGAAAGVGVTTAAPVNGLVGILIAAVVGTVVAGLVYVLG